MREHEMRQRVQSFIQKRVRAMLMPATLGLGLSLGGCASDALNVDDGGEAEDASGAADVEIAAKYMAQLPDAGPPIAAEYMAQLPREDAAVMRYMAQLPDAGRDLLSVAVYMAQLPRK